MAADGITGAPANAPSTTEVAPPCSLDEALAIADLSKLAVPADVSRNQVTQITYSFSAPVTAARTVDSTVADLKKLLDAGGWRPVEDFTPAPNEFGTLEYFERDGLMSMLSIGKSRGFQGEDINVSLMLVGNVDARGLPTPKDVRREIAEPGSLIYHTSLRPLDVRKYYKETLPTLGWIECRRPDIPGVEIPMEQKELMQSFIQRGVYLDINYQPAADATRVLVRPSLVKYELPIPRDAKSVDFGDDPPYLFCSTKQRPTELADAFAKFLEQRGWKRSEPVSKERAGLVLGFSAEGREPLWLGISDREKIVYLQLKVDRPN